MLLWPWLELIALLRKLCAQHRPPACFDSKLDEAWSEFACAYCIPSAFQVRDALRRANPQAFPHGYGRLDNRVHGPEQGFFTVG